jgi:integrase
VAAVTAPDFEDDDLPDPATLYDLDLPDRAVWDADDEPDAPTLGDWFEEWWSTRPPGRPAERTRDERLARTQILPEWGAVPLSELSAGALQSWVTHMAGPSGGRLPSVEVRRTIQLLDGCLEAAVEEALVTENPASHVALPASDARPRRVLTDDELWRLAGAMDRPYRAFVLLAGFCGLRLGELLALRWSAIDIPDARVDITETLLDGGGVLRIERPRSNAAIRSIRLPSFVAAELERKAELGVDPDQLVFPSAEGHLLRPTAFRRSFWLPAVHDAGLAPLGIHDLRPTAVAIWISEGATPEQVAKLAGHSSPAVVVELYGDLFPDGDERLLAALERRESGRGVASG